MLLLHYTDLHLSDVSPISRTETYPEDMLLKLRQIYEIGKQHRVDYYVNTGDTFNIKTASKTSHWLVQRAYEILDGDYAKTILLPGGHDLANGRLESLSKQPLGVISKSKNVVLIEKGKFELNGFSWVGLPGIPEIENAESAEPLLQYGDADICLLHGAISYPWDKYPFITVPAGDLAGHFSLVLYGHIHTGSGMNKIGNSETGEQTVFINYGAISRGSYVESNLLRIPTICLVNISKVDKEIKVSYMPKQLVVKPSAIVFRMEELRHKDEVKEEVNSFLDKLKNTDLLVMDRSALIDKIRGMGNIDNDVKEGAIEVLEYVEK